MWWRVFRVTRPRSAFVREGNMSYCECSDMIHGVWRFMIHRDEVSILPLQLSGWLAANSAAELLIKRDRGQSSFIIISNYYRH